MRLGRDGQVREAADHEVAWIICCDEGIRRLWPLRACRRCGFAGHRPDRPPGVGSRLNWDGLAMAAALAARLRSAGHTKEFVGF